MIRDLAGRVHVAAIMTELRRQFPVHRVPRRSTLYRHVSVLLRATNQNQRS